MRLLYLQFSSVVLYANFTPICVTVHTYRIRVCLRRAKVEITSRHGDDLTYTGTPRKVETIARG